MNRKADFLQIESIRTTNRIDSNRELEMLYRIGLGIGIATADWSEQIKRKKHTHARHKIAETRYIQSDERDASG